MQRRVAIIGGLGKTGRRVFERLQGRGIDAHAASRSSKPAFDWTDRATWPLALRGATAAYVAYQPDVALPRAADDIGMLAGIAADVGVEHMVLLSARGQAGARRSEECLRRAPLDHTIIRASWFAQNFSEGSFLGGIIAGDLALPADEVQEPFVSADDIADAAVEALCDPAHLNRTYEITGPRSLRFAEAVAEIAAASGRPIRYRTVPPDEFLSGLRAAGAAREAMWPAKDVLIHKLDGRNEKVAGDAERILGRKPIDFSDYARQAGRQGVWTAHGDRRTAVDSALRRSSSH
jgi:uncharacterized protein YbjT (DUF2867 family)